MKYQESELIINADGSIFHLHIRPEQLAQKVILVGDPDRVNNVASYFDSIECEISSREFHTITGMYKGKRITCLSTGIGCDNIDIAMNELDALANIDFNTLTDKPNLTSLEIVRVGTCGGLQPDTPIGSFVASEKSIGFDGLLNYYADRNKVCDIELEKTFTEHMSWSPIKGAPYITTANQELTNRIACNDMIRGITVACGGFYGPQGRQIRMDIQDPEQNAKLQTFRYTNCNGHELKICNFEMESSALFGLASLLGHKATTCCMVLANRYSKKMNTNYKTQINDLISLVLDRF